MKSAHFAISGPAPIPPQLARKFGRAMIEFAILNVLLFENQKLAGRVFAGACCSINW